jgi:hypothetical protein
MKEKQKINKKVKNVKSEIDIDKILKMADLYEELLEIYRLTERKS